MYQIIYPQFDNLDQLLWDLIESKLPEFVEKCKQINISEHKLREQVDKEYKMLVSKDIVGLYYLLVKSF